MMPDSDPPIAATAYTRLERQIDALLRTLERLALENTALRAREQALVAERAQLIENSEHARTRVEAMITRLRAMEQE